MKRPCTYRVSTKGLVVKDGKVLLCLRGDGLWNLPGGGLEFDQSFHDNLRKEFDEELGIKIKNISEKPIYLWTEKREDDDRDRLLLCYRVEPGTDDFKTKIDDDCVEARFFTKDELEELNLHQNDVKLREFFNPEDFE